MTDRIDLHTHTIASGHAYNTIYEMAYFSSKRGLELLGITDHGPSMPGTCPQSYFNNLRMVPKELFGMKMMYGCEVNILDQEGHIDLPQSVLDRLDYTVASIHNVCYTRGTARQNTDAYLAVMKNPYVRIIGHPDDAAFPVEYERLVLGAKENHVLLEVNNNSLNPRCVRKGTRDNYLVMLEYCRKYQVPIIMDSDAHCEIDAGNHKLAVALLEEIGFPEELVVNRSLEAVAEFIPRLKERLLIGI